MAFGVVDFFKDKNMLVIGGTGFLGKVFIEKILRVQPEVGQIFTLVRAKDLKSAQAKIQKEMIFTELFRLLQDRYGGEYENFMAQKIIPVVGDVSIDDYLGIEEEQRDEICSKVDIVVNLAATTKFYERYDVSLGVNVVGAIHAINFCRKCKNLQILIHVSTAYVNVGRTGIIAEETVKIRAGVTFGPDYIKGEVDLIRKSLEETTSTAYLSDTKEESKRMKELGQERARNFGWPNVYVFTKAVGEMMVDQLRGDLPVVILRPAIIESTLAEPFPGWMEGNRMLDPLITGYGKGQIKIFAAKKNLIIDVVPVDMVVNCMIACMYKHAKEPDLFIYQVATSVENPLFYDVGVTAAYNYFLLHPCKTKKGKIVKVERPFVIRSMESFRQYMKLHYKIPIEVLYCVSLLLCGLQRQQYNQLLYKYNMVMKLATLYEPFIFFQGKFDNSNTNRLWEELSKEDQQKFMFDVKCIDWADYFFNVHIPGLLEYVPS
ncbi:hypothetical protein SUGI_0760310 [Cryptomeria japonica]|uniref:fatty acyl-CoA reductase 3 n=1 Tax=Cryptomeria japonica TaxID=3369 RepID=UPI00241468E7|nr:fatty acyl-CoA reductase 3 [Cryptomeria japonica]GLJ37424.1 hypothetical protein SUGI_0760310 [Cryptomeria japonica]